MITFLPIFMYTFEPTALSKFSDAKRTKHFAHLSRGFFEAVARMFS